MAKNIYDMTKDLRKKAKNDFEKYWNYIRLSILELSKILVHEFWYDYVKPKYSEKAKL